MKQFKVLLIPFAIGISNQLIAQDEIPPLTAAPLTHYRCEPYYVYSQGVEYNQCSAVSGCGGICFKRVAGSVQYSSCVYDLPASICLTWPVTYRWNVQTCPCTSVFAGCACDTSSYGSGGSQWITINRC